MWKWLMAGANLEIPQMKKYCVKTRDGNYHPRGSPRVEWLAEERYDINIYVITVPHLLIIAVIRVLKYPACL
jgi:hypothetical protein